MAQVSKKQNTDIAIELPEELKRLMEGDSALQEERAKSGAIVLAKLERKRAAMTKIGKAVGLTDEELADLVN